MKKPRHPETLGRRVRLVSTVYRHPRCRGWHWIMGPETVLGGPGKAGWTGYRTGRLGPLVSRTAPDAVMPRVSPRRRPNESPANHFWLRALPHLEAILRLNAIYAVSCGSVKSVSWAE